MADLNTDDPSDVADGTGPGSSGNLATETFSPLSPAESLQSIRSNRISIQSNEKLAGSRADIAPEPSESSANAPDAGTPAAPSNPGLSAHHITIPTSNFTNKPNDSPPSTPSLARDANPPLNASHLRALALDNARLRTLLQKCETKLRDSEKKREGMEGELARTAEEAKRAAEDGKRLGKALASLEKDRTHLRTKLATLTSENQMLCDNLSELEKTRLEMDAARLDSERRAASVEATYANLRTDQNALLSRLLSLHLDLRSKSSALRSLQHALDLSREESDRVSREGRGERGRLEGLVEGLRRELETKEGELRRREGEREGWENDKREREGVIRGLEARMGKLERTLRDAEGERDSCKARNVALGAELEGEKSEGRKVKAELDSLRRILDEREDALKRATLEIRRLRGDRTREDDSQTRLKQTHLDLARLEKLLEAERIKVRALEDELATPPQLHPHRTLPITSPESSELLSKLSHLQSRTIIQNSRIDSLVKELEDRKRESEEWKTKYERACKVSEGSKKTARDKGLESEVEMYKFQLDEARKEIMVLKSVPVTSSNGTLDGRDRSRPGSGR